MADQESKQDLVGIYEIAQMAKVTPPAVVNWRSRFQDFPQPIAELRSGPVFDRQQVRKWLRTRRTQMATVVSVINLKGGVGKSTTTVALAEMMSVAFQKKVLVVDQDPQTNSTIMLIGEDKWKELNDQKLTLAQLYVDALEEDPSKRKFDLNKALQKQVSNVQEVRGVDLLPSSLADLIEVQDRLAWMPRGPFFANNPTEILRRAIRHIIDEYNYVLIDCPPNLGIITLNGLRISNGFVIPVIPDYLSTYGIPQILDRVEKFAATVGEPIEPLGIVISKYRQQSTVHKNVLQQLRRKGDPLVFESIIPENNQIADSAEFKTANPPSTLRQKYGYAGQYDIFYNLTQEVMKVAQS